MLFMIIFFLLIFSLTRVDLVGDLRIVAAFMHVGTCMGQYATSYGDDVQLLEQSPTCHLKDEMELNIRTNESQNTSWTWTSS